MAKLSVAVRRAMKEKKLSATEFAKEAGLARSTIFNVLAGNDTDIETLRKLKKVGVRIPPVNDLLDGGDATRAA